MSIKKQKYKTILLGLLIIILAALAPAAYGQESQPQINLQVQPSFEGNYKYGEWLPLWLTLENEGQDLEVEASVTIDQSGGRATYAIPVSLPAGSRKQVPLYILPNNFSREVVVRVTASNKEITKETVPVTPSQNDYYLIGIASPEMGPLSQIVSLDLEQTTRKVISFNLATSNLPEKALALNSLDAIILNDTDTSQLTPEQTHSLSTWIRNGGRLIIGGGPGLEKTIAGLPEEIVQFDPQTLLEVESLPSLETFSGEEPILVNGPFLTNQATQNSGVPLAEEKENSIVHEWELGNGYVDFIALDLTASPFNAWSGTPIFWQNLLSPDSSFPMWLPRDTSIRQMRASSMYYPLTNQPSLDLPSVRGLGILLAAYIVLVGPVNYFVLRKKKRLQLAWLTIPLLTAVFTAGAFGLAQLLRGNDILVNNISIVNLQPDGSADVTSYIGVFSPSEDTYTIDVSGSPLLSLSGAGYYDPWSSYVPPGSGDTRFVQGNPAKVTGLNINQWSLNSFNAESLSAQIGTIKTDLTLQNGRLSGTVENQLPYSINDAVLVVGMLTEKIGTLEPDETVEINLDFNKDITAFGTPSTYQIIEQLAQGQDTTLYSREYEMKRSILDGVFQPFGYWLGPNFGIPSSEEPDQFTLSSTYIVGWLNSSPIEVSLDGKTANQKALALLSYYPSLQIDPEGFTLPASTIPGSLSEQPLNGGYCGGSSTYVFLERGDATLEFTVPDKISNAAANQLSIEIRDESAWNLNEINIDLSVYDWDEKDWVEFDGITNGANLIENPQGLISETGAVKINISRSENNFGGGCIYVALGMNGSLNQ